MVCFFHQVNLLLRSFTSDEHRTASSERDEIEEAPYPPPPHPLHHPLLVPLLWNCHESNCKHPPPSQACNRHGPRGQTVISTRVFTRYYFTHEIKSHTKIVKALWDHSAVTQSKRSSQIYMQTIFIRQILILCGNLQKHKRCRRLNRYHSKECYPETKYLQIVNA